MVTLTLLPAAPAGVPGRNATVAHYRHIAGLRAAEQHGLPHCGNWKPEMVTAVPPAAGPVFGLTPVAMGEAVAVV